MSHVQATPLVMGFLLAVAIAMPLGLLAMIAGSFAMIRRANVEAQGRRDEAQARLLEAQARQQEAQARLMDAQRRDHREARLAITPKTPAQRYDREQSPRSRVFDPAGQGSDLDERTQAQIEALAGMLESATDGK